MIRTDHPNIKGRDHTALVCSKILIAAQLTPPDGLRKGCRLSEKVDDDRP